MSNTLKIEWANTDSRITVEAEKGMTYDDLRLTLVYEADVNDERTQDLVAPRKDLIEFFQSAVKVFGD